MTAADSGQPRRPGPLAGLLGSLDSWPVLIPFVGVLALGARGGVAWSSWENTRAALLGGAVAVGVAALLWLVSVSRGGGRRTVTAHIHPGHGPRSTARHEAGHVAVGRAVGGTVVAAKINRDGSGYTAISLPKSVTPMQIAAIGLAGSIAARSSSGCGSDFSRVRAALREVPREQRAAVRREARDLATKVCRGWSSPIPAIADQLYRDGGFGGRDQRGALR